MVDGRAYHSIRRSALGSFMVSSESVFCAVGKDLESDCPGLAPLREAEGSELANLCRRDNDAALTARGSFWNQSATVYSREIDMSNDRRLAHWNTMVHSPYDRKLAKGILLERTAWIVGLIVFFVMGYFGVAMLGNRGRTHVLMTVMDDKIPFLAGSIWLYLWAFPCALIPLFVVRCPMLFRRTAIGYAALIAVSLLCFAVFPVTSLPLRIPPTRLEVSGFSGWAIARLYALDPPYNLFPSLHVSISALAAFSVWKASRPYGAAALASLGFVAASVCTTKQHYLLDVLGGLTLSALVGGVLLGRCGRLKNVDAAYSWRGPALYLGLVAVFYSGWWMAFVYSL